LSRKRGFFRKNQVVPTSSARPVFSWVSGVFMGQKNGQIGEQRAPVLSITDVQSGGKPSEEEAVFHAFRLSSAATAVLARGYIRDS